MLRAGRRQMGPLRVKQLEIHSLLTQTPGREEQDNQWKRLGLRRPRNSHSQSQEDLPSPCRGHRT